MKGALALVGAAFVVLVYVWVATEIRWARREQAALERQLKGLRPAPYDWEREGDL